MRSTTVQRWGDGRTVYSRAITPVGGAYIIKHHAAYGGLKPVSMDQQGIDDAFIGKASEVLYLYRGMAAPNFPVKVTDRSRAEPPKW